MSAHSHEHADTHEHADVHRHDDDCCGHDHADGSHHDHGHSEHTHGHGPGEGTIAVKPREGADELSWYVVALIYMTGSVICGVLAVLHFAFQVEQVKGFWLIFSLFPPCLIYAIVKHRAQVGTRQKAKAKAD